MIPNNWDTAPLIKPGDGCSFHRIQLPFMLTDLDLMGAPFKTKEELFAQCKILTFSRDSGSLPVNKLLDLRKQYGFKIVVDVDDWLDLTPTHTLYAHWMKNKIWDKYKSFLPLMDAITVTTPRLAEKMKTINKNVFVIPNGMPFRETRHPALNQFLFNGYHEGDQTRFIWAGGATHYRDLKTQLSGVFRAYPTLNFTMAGYNDTTPDSKLIWDRMERLCSFNYHNPKYQVVHTKPLESYATAFDYQDVALAPLDIADTWVYYKSSLKAYEAGVKRMACIASACPPYTDDLPDDVVTFCKSSSDWIEAIRKHKDLAYAREQGMKLYKWVKRHRNLDVINGYRFQVYDFIKRGGSAEDAPTYEQFTKPVLYGLD
jgi:hypothetical protein